MALFTEAPRTGFRVFDESGRATIFSKQQPLDFCKRCNSHYSQKFCSRAPSRGNCGFTMHSEDLCKASTRCKTCRGPHRSDSRKFLARPNRLGAPSKEQLKTYRQAGEREFQAVARAKAIEACAEATQISAEISGNSRTEIIEVAASSVETSADDTRRL